MSERMHLQLRTLLDDLRSLDLEQRDLWTRSARFGRDRRKHTQVGDLERQELELELRDAVAEAGVLEERGGPSWSRRVAISLSRRNARLQLPMPALLVRSCDSRNFA